MTQAIQSKTAGEILNTVYKTVKTSIDSILNLMPKVKNEDLKSDMTVQLSALEAFASRTVKLLAEEDVKPEDEGTLSKMSAKWGTMVNTMMDSSSSHLAQMLIEEATAGSAELTRLLRESENKSISEAALRLLRDVCAFEDKIIKDMKAYL
ncbi:MAG: hypothetical protein IJW49_10675 [Clostridia bacterium]|nr:hypothetical protein [Clostridia bacterium]